MRATAGNQATVQSRTKGGGESAYDRRPRFRWRVLVDWREQIVGMSAGLAVSAVLLIALNVALHVGRTASIEALAIDDQLLLSSMERERDASTRYTAACSAILFVGLALSRLLESHKFEGPSIKMTRRLREIETGNYRGVATLRKSDRLRPLAQSINSMTIALRDRARNEAKELENLAARARRVDSQYAAKDLSTELLKLAERKRGHYE